jgi:hypothetical protein
VQERVAKIDEFVENDHHNARLWVGAANADSIFAKVQQFCAGIFARAHSQPGAKVGRSLGEGARTELQQE